jgi:hypothetical protein
MKIEISSVINSIAEDILKRGTEKKILFISVKLSYNYYDTIKGRLFQVESPLTSVNFIFYRPSNYMKVLFNNPNKGFFGPMDFEGSSNWELKANHDSCWRTDGVENTLREFHNFQCKELERLANKTYGNKISGVDIRDKFYNQQPSFSKIQRIEILDGEVSLLGNDEIRHFSCKQINRFFSFYRIS